MRESDTGTKSPPSLLIGLGYWANVWLITICYCLMASVDENKDQV